jgi:hypothetical protein
MDDALVVQGEVDALGFGLRDYVLGARCPKRSWDKVFVASAPKKHGKIGSAEVARVYPQVDRACTAYKSVMLVGLPPTWAGICNGFGVVRLVVRWVIHSFSSLSIVVDNRQKRGLFCPSERLSAI